MKRLIVIAITIAVLVAMLFSMAAAGASYRSGVAAFTLHVPVSGADSYHYVYARETTVGTVAILYVSLSIPSWLPIATAKTYLSETQSGQAFASVRVICDPLHTQAADYYNYSTSKYYSHVWLRGSLITYDWSGRVWEAASNAKLVY